MSTNDFRAALRERTLVADGAMGTQLRAYLHENEREGALELLNLTRPELVMHVHREYAEAGAEVLITNTFGASALRLRALGREQDLEAVNRRAVELAEAFEQVRDVAREDARTGVGDGHLDGAVHGSGLEQHRACRELEGVVEQVA